MTNINPIIPRIHKKYSFIVSPASHLPYKSLTKVRPLFYFNTNVSTKCLHYSFEASSNHTTPQQLHKNAICLESQIHTYQAICID